MCVWARARVEDQEGKVTGILPGNSNVASVSNARAKAEVVEKEKNNNKNKSKVQTTDGVEFFPPAGSKCVRQAQHGNTAA